MAAGFEAWHHGVMSISHDPPRLLNAALLAPLLPARAKDMHKKQAVVFLIAGSAQYLGAAILCARGAYRAGASLVRLALPESLADAAMSALPEMVVHRLAAGPWLSLDQSKVLQALAKDAHAVVVGPGLGRHPETLALVRQLWQDLPQPCVFDADALAALDLAQAPGGPRVLTPHEGELKLILGPSSLDAGRPAAARTLAQRAHGVALLKGPGTLIALPDGTLSENPSGSSVLATAGSGDVLSGAIAALMAQGAEPYDAACLGAWIHGTAGQAWAAEHADRGLLASDLADRLPDALKQLAAP